MCGQEVIVISLVTVFTFSCGTLVCFSGELDIPASQLLGLLNTMLRKYTANLKASQEAVIAKSLKASVNSQSSSSQEMAPLASSMNDELEEAAKELKAKQQRELDKMKLGMDLSQYHIKGDDKEWEQALSGQKASKVLSVKTGEKRLADELKNGAAAVADEDQQPSKKKKKNKKAKKAAAS